MAVFFILWELFVHINRLEIHDELLICHLTRVWWNTNFDLLSIESGFNAFLLLFFVKKFNVWAFWDPENPIKLSIDPSNRKIDKTIFTFQWVFDKNRILKIVQKLIRESNQKHSRKSNGKLIIGKFLNSKSIAGLKTTVQLINYENVIE